MTGTVREKLFKLNTSASEFTNPRERGRRQSSNNENINNVFFGGLLNCLFKVYVFMVCRTRWCFFARVWGVGETRNECTWFVFISESYVCVVLGIRGLLLSSATSFEREMIHLIMYFQNQPYTEKERDRLKAEMSRAREQKQGLDANEFFSRDLTFRKHLLKFFFCVCCSGLEIKR